MFEFFVRANREYRERVAGIDVGTLLGSDATRLVSLAEEMKRQADALLTLAIGRVSSSGAWANGRARCTEEWVAQATGASWGEARGRVAMASALQSLPETAAALAEGRISGTQAALVARAAEAEPHSEGRMLDLAGRVSVKELRTASERIVATASGRTDDEQTAVHRTRHLRTWVDAAGGFNIQGRMTKAAGAQVLAALEPLMEAEFTDARRQGRREAPDAYRADALLVMAERAVRGCGADDPEAPPRAEIIVRVDHAALVRGRVEGTEMCEIEGLGPVPVADVERLMGDAFVTVLRTTGQEVTSVSTTTRVIRKSLRSAVIERDRVCVVPGCGIGTGLEIDHLVPFAQGGETSIENLQRLCRHHHRLKTTGKGRLTRIESADGPRFGWIPQTDRCDAAAKSADRTETDADPPEGERTLWTD